MSGPSFQDDSDSPQAAFASFVKETLDEARHQRGWSVAEVAAETGVGRSTLFRWLAGDWLEYPELGNVLRFCAALDASVSRAFAALKVPADEPRPTRAHARAERDLRIIREHLHDPRVSAAEKQRITEALRRLALRVRRDVG